MLRFLRLFGLAIVILIVALLFNTWRAGSGSATAPAATLEALDEATLATRLAAVVAIPTISSESGTYDLAPFARLHAQLLQDFPRLHQALKREVINEASLLYHWPGSDAACAPVLLLAHQDVVPVEAGTEAQWTHPPFGGVVADGYVWGRGTVDDKGMLMAAMEAIEALLAQGHKPRCSVWLAFGHDEEIGGEHGARALAARLQALGVKPAFVLDEGGGLTQGVVPGVPVPVATIGVAEKGYVSVRLTARSEGGHSSMPPRRTPVGRLAAAVARLEEQRPPASLSPVQRELLRRLAPHMAFGQRVAVSNLWLTAPLVQRLFASAPASDATQRTTTAPTMFNAGVKDNVLPQQAQAVINFRIQPGDSVDGVLAHVRRVVDDADLEIVTHGEFSGDPTVPAPWDNEAFMRIESALRQVSSESPLVVAPYVTSGGTDARHYSALTPNLYRVGAVLMLVSDIKRIHGTDERIAVAEYARTVRFYLSLLRAL